MSGKDAHPEPALGGTAIKPPGWDRTGWEAFRYMLFDPSNGTILTRTPLSWIKIFVFYCIYYTALAAFWVACLQIFFITISEHEPRWTLKESLIGANPGVGLRPGTSDEKIDSSLYIFNLKDYSTDPTNPKGEGETNADVARRMDLYMQKYNDQSELVDCSGSVSPSDQGRCLFPVTELGECSAFPYGLMPSGGKVKPCFFLKLNKIYGFKPEPIDVTNLQEEFKEGLPNKVKDLINTHGGDNVYMDCKGRFPADNEGDDHQDIDLEYFPASQTIPLKYFPFMNGPNYHSPMVAVRINNPPTGRMIHIECRAYYHGVVHSTKDKIGLTQFEVMVQ